MTMTDSAYVECPIPQYTTYFLPAPTQACQPYGYKMYRMVVCLV